MGIEIETAKFLVRCRSRGVSFRDIATLARHNLFVGNRELRQLFGRDVETTPYNRYRYSERFFAELGAERITVIDNSRVEAPDAFVHDLNLPIPPELHSKFDTVLDLGTLEHVFNFPVALSSAMRMVKPGGHLIIATVGNNFTGHGFYQFSPELFFRALSAENGFEIEEMVACEYSPTRRWFTVIDPATHADRGCVVNAWPVILFLRAKRHSERELFSAYPQQSDYVAQWTGNATEAQTGMVDVFAGRRFETYKRWLLETFPGFSRMIECIRFSSWNPRFSFRNKQAFRRTGKNS